MTTRGRKPKPGRITFVGSGPGDPGLLTTRARRCWPMPRWFSPTPTCPRRCWPWPGPSCRRRRAPSRPTTADRDARDVRLAAIAHVIPGGPDIRPALGDPAEVAKTLATEARAGVDVVRLVAGDPLSVDSVITEVTALARTHLNFEIVPGLPDTTAVPTYAGLPLGSSHTVADVRGDVDWAALAAAPGPLILHATASHLPDAARTLIEYGLADATPLRGHRAGHHLPAALGGSHAGRTDRQGRDRRRRTGRSTGRAAGGHDRQDRRQPRRS